MTRFGPLSPALFRLTVFGLALTGAAQMPIFKRYYVADVPGLGWLDDFHLTHVLHYALAAVLLFWLAGRAGRALAGGRPAAGLTWGGVVRLVLWALVIATGYARMAKNMPGLSLGPVLVQAVDLAHLGAAVLLGLAALAGGRRR